MRYERTRPSGKDNQINVYEISLGIQEIDLLVGLLNQAIHYTPRCVETQIPIQRMRQMRTTLDGIKQKRLRGLATE